MVNRRGRTRTTRRRNNPIRTMTRTIVRHETGTSFKPSPTPPMWTASPWWSLTLVNSYVKDEVITVTTVANYIRLALGWNGYVKGTSSLPISFRMVSVRLYGLASQPIQLTAYEILGGKHIARETNNFGGKFTYSTCGWRWGTQSRIDVLQESDLQPEGKEKLRVCSFGGASETQKVLLYIQVLFKAADAPTASFTSLRARIPLSLDDMEL